MIPIIKSLMQKASHHYKTMNVDLKIEYGVGQHWGEAH